MNIVYRRENGYGTLDIHAEPFQVGRRLYETQRELINTEAGKPDVLKLGMIAQWYCELVAWVGQLRADYSSLQEVLKGKAVYEYTEDGLRYRVRRECLGRAPEEKKA